MKKIEKLNQIDLPNIFKSVLYSLNKPKNEEILVSTTKDDEQKSDHLPEPFALMITQALEFVLTVDDANLIGYEIINPPYDTYEDEYYQ
jgi:hypothetical protein